MEKKQDKINWAIPIVIAVIALTIAFIALFILNPESAQSFKKGTEIFG